MWDPELYKTALDFAAQAHGMQRVPGTGFPYVVHLCKVCAEVQRALAADPEHDINLAMACALLHDCVEDVGVHPDLLVQEFGEAVAAGVMALSKDPRLPKEQRMADSLARLRKQPREVQAVKLADRITNLEPPPAAWSEGKRRLYLAESALILEALQGAHAGLAQRLRVKMAEYEVYIVPDP